MGCVLGVLLMRLFEHSLVYYLEQHGHSLRLAGYAGTTGLIALGCILLASLIGARARSIRPGGRAASDPYDLIRCEG